MKKYTEIMSEESLYEHPISGDVLTGKEWLSEVDDWKKALKEESDEDLSDEEIEHRIEETLNSFIWVKKVNGKWVEA